MSLLQLTQITVAVFVGLSLFGALCFGVYMWIDRREYQGNRELYDAVYAYLRRSGQKIAETLSSLP